MADEIRMAEKPRQMGRGDEEDETERAGKEGAGLLQMEEMQTPHTLEDILHSVGALGRWQMANLVIIGWVMLLLGAINMFIAFLQVKPKFVCSDNIHSGMMGTNWTYDNIR